MRESKPFGKRRISSKEELDKVIKGHSERNFKNRFDDTFGLTQNSSLKVIGALFSDRQDLDTYVEDIK